MNVATSSSMTAWPTVANLRCGTRQGGYCKDGRREMARTKVTITGYLENTTLGELREYENDLYQDELVGRLLYEFHITFTEDTGP